MAILEHQGGRERIVAVQDSRGRIATYTAGNPVTEDTALLCVEDDGVLSECMSLVNPVPNVAEYNCTGDVCYCEGSWYGWPTWDCFKMWLFDCDGPTYPCTGNPGGCTGCDSDTLPCTDC